MEHADTGAGCAIWADERQYVPAAGQQWTTLGELAAGGHATQVHDIESDLFGVTVRPAVGIGHQAYLLRGPAGGLLWDPPGYVDDAAVERLGELGGAVAVAASHPHMFGAQVEWARRLGDVPVLLAALVFDRVYDNFGGCIDTDARGAVRRSADRYIRWVSGEFDHLT